MSTTRCGCERIGDAPLDRVEDLPPTMVPLAAPGWPAQAGAGLYRCEGCERLWSVVHDHFQGFLRVDAQPAKLGGLLAGAAQPARLIDYVSRDPAGLDARACELATRVGQQQPGELQAAVDEVLDRLELGVAADCAPSLAGWLRLFCIWAGERIAAAAAPPSAIGEFSRLSREDQIERVVSQLARGASAPAGPPIGEADPHGEALALRVAKLGPALDALARLEQLTDAGPERGRLLRGLRDQLHRELLARACAPANRQRVWMPDADWQRLFDEVGREGRTRRAFAGIAALLDAEPLAVASLFEQLIGLERLLGPEAPATDEQIALLERLAAALERLPVTLPFSDPVADARYQCRQALQHARGGGPTGQTLSP